MDFVLKEGGPFHTRGPLKYYLNRLKKSGRVDMVKVILDRKESYNFSTSNQIRLMDIRTKASASLS